MTFRWTVRALLALGLVVVGATAASAHDSLTGSDPADATVLTTAPDRVVLTFSADQLAVGTALEVVGPDGAGWVDGAPVVAGSTVTQALLPGLPDGDYTVLWRSVSGDGHPVEGTLTFSLDLPEADPAPEPAGQPTEQPTEEPVEQPTEPIAEPTGQPADEGVDAPAQVAAEQDPTDVGAGPLEWLLAGLAVVAAVGVAVAVILRRRGGGA